MSGNDLQPTPSWIGDAAREKELRQFTIHAIHGAGIQREADLLTWTSTRYRHQFHSPLPIPEAERLWALALVRALRSHRADALQWFRQVLAECRPERKRSGKGGRA